MLNLLFAWLKKITLVYVASTLTFSVVAAPLLKRGTEQQTQQQHSSNLIEQETTQGSSAASYELFKQMEAMQIELQYLRGMLEEQNYTIERLQKAEKERYADLDRRINEIQMQKNQSTMPLPMNADTQQALSTNPSVVMDEDAKTYNSAKQKVDSKEYNAAIAEFTLYLEFFPHGKYVPQAHYWLGELYMALTIPEYENAQKHFEVVVKEFPSHAKVPDSLYKIGFIQKTQNKKDAAKLSFQKLINEFPKSASASLAKTQLETL